PHTLSYSLSSTPTSSPHLYTLSLHDALPIFAVLRVQFPDAIGGRLEDFRIARQRLGIGILEVTENGEMDVRVEVAERLHLNVREDRKSTRLNSSHLGISYAVFCLKKKKKNKT